MRCPCKELLNHYLPDITIVIIVVECTHGSKSVMTRISQVTGRGETPLGSKDCSRE